MNKRFLEDCLAKGMSLPQIGKLAGKHPSTVGYWLKKHELEAVGRKQYAPKGGVDHARLGQLVEEGASLRQIAAQLGVSFTTVRHWMGRLGLETESAKNRRQTSDALRLGLKRIYRRCPRHGRTAFYARPDGGFRCMKCNKAGVLEWRRGVKRRLVEAAGGACAVCGFDEYPGALHFHHLDPKEKEFALSRQGVTRAFAKARREADKCILLCANCHAKVEGGVIEVPKSIAKVVAT
jgi:transposase